METNAKRTLVKSAPELWELADDQTRMEAWMGGLAGTGTSVPVEVIDRKPERALAWRRADGDADLSIALELAEKGFGTSVRIKAEHPGAQLAPDTLERLLDELGSPERKPFTNA